MHNPFAVVARACEELNAFAGTLRQSAAFKGATTGTDLRLYRSGWKFEKYVEAQLNPKEGYVAVWWLELSEEDHLWKIVGNTSISYGDFNEDVAAVITTDDELDTGLSRIVKALIESSAPGHPFRLKIDQLLRDAEAK